MIKIEITLPLLYNDGKLIELRKFEKIKRELIKEFGGLSISRNTLGYWIKDDKEYEDLNEIYTIVTDKPKVDLYSWLSGYKKWLMHNLEQKDIFIVVSEVQTI